MNRKQSTRFPVAFGIPSYLALLATIPAVLATAPMLLATETAGRIAAAALAPIIYGLSYVVLAGVMTIPFQRRIVRGKFPRDMRHSVYGPRRMYGLGWGAVFYFTPLYFALMSVPALRKLLLHLFGYRGSRSANIAPDAWLRDLPLLKFSENAYVANKSTIGTNMCLIDGSILVDEVTIGRNAMVGHLAMVAPGSVLGDGSELGVGAALGVRTKVGSRTRVGPKSGVGHGARLGDNVDIGTMSYIGIKARISDGVKIPGGSNIPEGAEITSSEDVERLLESEALALKQEVSRLRMVYSGQPEKRAVGGL
jgi:carbonic anhydrase/acetyltransferase-like protein (isoleucine patch superfamily)